MFGMDFPEFVVIAVVALIVLGPERLPKAARFVGLWVRRARSQWNSVRSELERELAADEIKHSLRDTEAAMRDIDADLRATDADARREFESVRDDLAGPSATKARQTAAAGATDASTLDTTASPADAPPLMTGPLPPSAPPHVPGGDSEASPPVAAPHDSSHDRDDIPRT
ncbi:MAG: Sec-independent protein translocase protein TatB [Luteimonas sp.]